MTPWRLRFPWTASVLGFLWPDGPARRKRWVVTAAVMIALLATHAGLTAVLAVRAKRAERDFIARWGPLDMAAHRPPAVEDGKNAARAVLAATRLMALPHPVDARARLYEKFAAETEGDLTESARDAIRGMVRANALALSILDEAAARPGSNWEIHYEWGVEAEVPPLRDIVWLAKLNTAAGRLALDEGRPDDALTALRRGRAIARSLEAEPLVIVQLVRLAVTRLDARLARLLLGRLDPDPERLTALSALLVDDRPRQRLQEAMLAEAKSRTGLFLGSGGAASRRMRSEGSWLLGPLHAVARPYLFAEERVWLERMTGRIALLDVPRHARSSVDPEPRLRAWNVMGRVLEFESGAVVDRADFAEARGGLSRTAIALERYRAARGRPPGSLAELVPEFLEEPLEDPLTGRPFDYASDGVGWSLGSGADERLPGSEGTEDPVLRWSRPLTHADRAVLPSRPS